MKKKRMFIPFLFIVSLTLSGCSFFKDLFASFNNEEGIEIKETEDEDQNDDNEGQGTIDYEIPKDKVGEFYGGLVNDNIHVGYEFSASLDTISKPKSGEGEVKIYSFNDFHGAVLESENEAGLKAFASFYKEKSKEDNTLIFDQGDTWQGSLESNSSYGGIVQDVFNYAGVSLRTVGNHDFDWGLDQLEETINRKLGDDYIPCLAANVYDFANGVTGTNQQSQYGKEYATFVLENGIKVGVVGVIGQLMSSICSNRIETVNFTNPKDKIMEMSDYLRVNKKCDIIVASTHNSVSYFNDDELIGISPVSNKRYVDVVLGGHEHSKLSFEMNGIQFSQSDSHGQSSAITTLKYDFSSNSIKEDIGYEIMERSDYYTYSTNVDPTINKMVDDYVATVDEIGNEVLSTNFSGYYSTSKLARLMSEAIFVKIKETGFDVDFAYTNGARETFYGNVFTYRDLYRCFPFDNEIVLMEIQNQGYDYGYRPSDYGQVDYTKEYFNCAIIDYVALHQNFYREYDNYPDSIVRSRELYKGENGETITYRDILREFLLENPDRDFSANNIR